MLYPHQLEGVKWLWSLFRLGRGGILADDMGLGGWVVWVGGWMSAGYVWGGAEWWVPAGHGILADDMGLDGWAGGWLYVGWVGVWIGGCWLAGKPVWACALWVSAEGPSLLPVNPSSLCPPSMFVA